MGSYGEDQLTVLRQRLAEATGDRNGITLMSIDRRAILIYAEEVELMEFSEAEAFLINLRPDTVIQIIIEGATLGLVNERPEIGEWVQRQVVQECSLSRDG